MRVIISFETCDDAFQDDGVEVARILRELAGKAEQGFPGQWGTDDGIRIKDANGNTVGTAREIL